MLQANSLGATHCCAEQLLIIVLLVSYPITLLVGVRSWRGELSGDQINQLRDVGDKRQLHTDSASRLKRQRELGRIERFSKSSSEH